MLCLMAPPLLAAAGVEVSGLQVAYQAESDTLSLEAREVELSQVLTQIGRQARIRVLMDPAVQRRVSASYSGRPLADVLASLLRDLNTMTLYRDTPGPGGGQRVAELRILPQGKESNGQLKTLVELEQEDLRQQRAMHREASRATREAQKKEKEADKVAARQQRIESLKESDPERYAKIMERMRAKDSATPPAQ